MESKLQLVHPKSEHPRFDTALLVSRPVVAYQRGDLQLARLDRLLDRILWKVQQREDVLRQDLPDPA